MLFVVAMSVQFSGLDLTGLVHSRDDPQPLYDLFAVSNHFGGMGGGHCQLLVFILQTVLMQSYKHQILHMPRIKPTRNGTILMIVTLQKQLKVI